MTPQQIVALGIRLVSILVALLSVRYLVSVPSMASVPGFNPGVVRLSYLFGGGCMAVAAFMWFFPMVIAHKMLPRTKFENNLKLNLLDAARVGCSLIGLWFFAQALPNVLWFFFASLTNAGEQSFIASLDEGQRITLVMYLSQLAIAATLIFKSDWFAKLVLRVQTEER